MKPQLALGLTGGIGTGKSYVARFFEQLGIPIYYADEEAKKFYYDKEVIEEIEKKIDSQIVVNGSIDFTKLKKILFSNKKKRISLEKIIHPRVKEDFLRWKEEQENEIVIMEAALIFEANFQTLFHYVITVDAPEELRIQRISQRNPNWTLTEIHQRIDAQLPQNEKCNRADFIISNDTTDYELRKQINKILLKIKKKAIE